MMSYLSDISWCIRVAAPLYQWCKLRHQSMTSSYIVAIRIDTRSFPTLSGFKTPSIRYVSPLAVKELSSCEFSNLLLSDWCGLFPCGLILSLWYPKLFKSSLLLASASIIYAPYALPRPHFLPHETVLYFLFTRFHCSNVMSKVPFFQSPNISLSFGLPLVTIFNIW